MGIISKEDFGLLSELRFIGRDPIKKASVLLEQLEDFGEWIQALRAVTIK